jgi:hypothetical protein
LCSTVNNAGRSVTEASQPTQPWRRHPLLAYRLQAPYAPSTEIRGQRRMQNNASNKLCIPLCEQTSSPSFEYDALRATTLRTPRLTGSGARARSDHGLDGRCVASTGEARPGTARRPAAELTAPHIPPASLSCSLSLPCLNLHPATHVPCHPQHPSAPCPVSRLHAWLLAK